jgi:hypothetical protein
MEGIVFSSPQSLWIITEFTTDLSLSTQVISSQKFEAYFVEKWSW